MTHITLAIIGAGPWGMAVLDRLVTRARTTVFRSGSRSTIQTRLAPACTIPTSPGRWTASRPGISARPLPGAMTFLEWVRAHSDPDCSAHGFLPRRTFGAYMRFVYDVLKDSLPANEQLEEHRDAVSHGRLTPESRLTFFSRVAPRSRARAFEQADRAIDTLLREARLDEQTVA